jgi:chromosome segregation ATPase
MLQTKTQLRVAQDQLTEKDAVIASLQEELGKHTANEQEMNQARAQATNWENSYNDMKNKVSHMDVLTNQIGEAKKLVVEKNIEVQNLQNQVQDLNNKVNSLNAEVETQKQQVVERDIQIVKLNKLVPSLPAPKKPLNTKKKSTTPSEEEAKAVEPVIFPTKVIGETSKVAAIKVVNVVDKSEEVDDF